MPVNLQFHVNRVDCKSFLCVVVCLMLFPNIRARAGENGLDERRQDYLQWVLEEFGAIEPIMKPLDGRAWSLNHARLATGTALDKANAYFSTIALTHDPDFMGIRLLRTLLQFGDTTRLSEESRGHLERIIRGWPMDKANTHTA